MSINPNHTATLSIEVASMKVHLTPEAAWSSISGVVRRALPEGGWDVMRQPEEIVVYVRLSDVAAVVAALTAAGLI